ncbi:MAG: hypothetical protein PHF33_09260, partial [Candidatus Delongbacteria bacterium]|nr:hypothetical protein [Candidatus Delongbacteria bacterium]
MRKIITYLIVLSIVQLFARPMFDIKNSDLSIQDHVKIETVNKGIVPYPENRVHRAGTMWLNITNLGYIGNPNVVMLGGYLFDDPCTGEAAKTAEMPGESDINYLSFAGLMFGGYLDSACIEISGTECLKFQGPLVSTSFDIWGGTNIPTELQNELQPVKFENDENGLVIGRIYESSNVPGRLNCMCQDVYDPKATAYEQFSVGFTDKLSERVYTGLDCYDQREHIPLGIEVIQKSYAWPYKFAQKFVIFDYTIYNRNENKKDIYDFFMALNADCDIGTGEWQCWDDMCGFIVKWDGYIDPATGENKPVEMNLAWTADNDGRNAIGYIDNIPIEHGSGYILDGALGIASVRVLRNPDSNLKYSFNLYTVDISDEAMDWGPRWQTGLHSDWQYDLTSLQKGYDDDNRDSLLNRYGHPMHGGRTEGYPAGDKGKYMVMSNDEFDYSQTLMREIYLGMNTTTGGTPIPQSDKWQRWTTENDLGNDGFSNEIADGSIQKLNDLANGEDYTFILSFGPLGNEAYVNVATDLDKDGQIDSYKNQKAWKFAYGDSLKLSIAFIVSENFHTSFDQNPNYADSTIVDLNDGLDVSLYDQGWYDAFNNVVW